MQDIILFHGSRGGIVGDIKPVSRPGTDFGSGFYMGTNEEQVKSLACQSDEPVFYKMKLQLSKINETKILSLDGMEWAFFVLYNRGKLEDIKDSELYNHFKHLSDDKEVIIGPIADDNLISSMKKFINNEITDIVFEKCIKSLNLGYQYVLKTDNACKLIEKPFLIERDINESEKNDIRKNSEIRKNESKEAVNSILHEYYGEGQFFSDILDNICSSTINRSYENDNERF